MPCYDSRADDYAREVSPKIEAALCGVMHALERGGGTQTLHGVLMQVDWKEAGVTRDWLVKWWKEHKEEDERRREREREARRQKQVKQSALIKAQKHLSYEEQKALGLTK